MGASVIDALPVLDRTGNKIKKFEMPKAKADTIVSQLMQHENRERERSTAGLDVDIWGFCHERDAGIKWSLHQ